MAHSRPSPYVHADIPAISGVKSHEPKDGPPIQHGLLLLDVVTHRHRRLRSHHLWPRGGEQGVLSSRDELALVPANCQNARS